MENCDYEAKAIQYRSEAEKRLASKGFWEALFGGGADRIEKALECFQKAGHMFKLAKNWLQAGTVYENAAELCTSTNEHHNAAILYVDAANCFKKSDHKHNTVQCLLKAVEIDTNIGRFLNAAKCCQMLGEIMEDDMDAKQAIKYFEQAANYYECENHATTANTCLAKVAAHAAILEDYSRAVKIFQCIAEFYSSTSVLRYLANNYFFHAALCYLCSEHDDIENILKQYVRICPSFEDSQQYQFLIKLAKCLEQCDEDGFTKICQIYENFSKLNAWRVTILLRIKRKISRAPDLR